MKRLFGVVEASLLAARALGFRAVAREAWRRLAGVPYAYRGVEVADSETFAVLRLLAARGRSLGRRRARVLPDELRRVFGAAGLAASVATACG